MNAIKPALTIAAALASAGALLSAHAGLAAAITQVTGTGPVTCTAGWTGSLTFLQPLKTGGTATQEEVVIKAQFSGCTGGTPTPSGGSYVAKGIVAVPGANDCANWFAASTASPPYKVVHFTSSARLDGNVAWSPSGINPSNVKFASMRIKSTAANRLTIKLPNPPASGTVTGSYAPAASLALRIGQTYPLAAAACSGPGVSTLAIVPATSSISSTGTW
ncbi:MAG TPA: hypothetical protein VGH27_33450 [Streptosporangiaceae bacterium]|jgi:hypothetical protein